MAGLKQTQLIANPVAFWTFDSDLNGLNNSQIVDEIQNQNPLTVNGINYELEKKSLNDLETTDQASVYICPNSTRELPIGGVEGQDEQWLNTFFESPTSTEFDFFNLGSFTIEFMYYKQETGEYQIENGSWTSHTPFIIKENVLNLQMYQTWSSVAKLKLDFFGRSIQINDDSGLNALFDQVNHIVIVHDNKQIDVNEYESTITIYMNGRNAASNTVVYIDEYPITTSRGSWLIAGNGGNDASTDYTTEQLRFDQIAIYNYAFDIEQVSHHYKKSVHYDELVKRDWAHRYWRMDEQDPFDSTMVDIGPASSAHDGVYSYGVLRNQVGPEKLVESSAQLFTQGGSSSVTVESSGDPLATINVNQNYTLEFWFKASSSKRGILFAATEKANPFGGLTVWLNTANNSEEIGRIQVNESKDQYITSQELDPTSEERLFWNDDFWHYLVVRRSGNQLTLWIDGSIQAETTATPVNNGGYSQAYMMNSPPGGYPVYGYMCEVAFYNYNLQDVQIRSRWQYTNRYKIEGYTLLQGVPISATVRFYDHINGELIGEKTTDNVTGLYQFYPATQRFVDVVSFIPDNKTTRYRVHGPIKPAEYDDSHLTT